MTTYFTSDLHFGHQNIIKYCNRPFANVKEMDQALVDNWNARVQTKDIVYVLGDVSFHPKETTGRILEALRGTIHLVKGNHDKPSKLPLERFSSVNDLLGSKVFSGQTKGKYIVMCHYAMKVWEHRHHGAWHLYGHSHGSMPDDPNSLSIDVGVDCHGYKPISFEEIGAIMSKKSAFMPVDHHGRGEDRE